MIDRWTLAKSKEEDLKYVSENDYVKIRIWFCHCKETIKYVYYYLLLINNVLLVIQKLAKRFGLRQQVVATAFVYFKRFYLK
jgi:cyclin C